MNWTKEAVLQLLDADDRAVIRALIRLYRLQTADEQAGHDTRYRNDMGFNSADAKKLTDIAEFYMQRGFLTPKQIALVRKRIRKYTRQLVMIANKQLGNQQAA